MVINNTERNPGAENVDAFTRSICSLSTGANGKRGQGIFGRAAADDGIAANGVAAKMRVVGGSVRIDAGLHDSIM